MAHHYHHHAPPLSTPCCCSSSCCRSGAPQHTLPQPLLDPLVEALISRLLQPPPPPRPPPQEPHKPFPRTHQEISFSQPHHHHPQQQYHPRSVSSLLDRIEALESSLHSFSISPPSPASCRRRRCCSLRDAAARIIQGHFRAFLVRRSRALRDLERLASVKSASLALRSSVYASSHLDLDRVSRKITALLLQLDSIQGNTSMIRDSKRKISRDLGCLLEYIDSLAVKRYEISYKAKKCVKSVGGRSKAKDLRDQIEVVNNLRTRVERVRELSRALENDAGEDVELEGFHNFGNEEVENGRVSRASGKRHGAKKVVSFAEDGNVYRIISSNSDEASLGGDDRDGIGGGEVLEDFRAHNDIEEMKGSSYVAEDDDDDDDEVEEAEMESGESLESSDGEKHQGGVRSGGKVDSGGGYKGQNSKFRFSAPVPEKMESRADLMKNRKNVKIVTSQQ
ncbi:uncharacterized protein J3R85_014661 [Psidium guajava]|nr:uncharacterized protein J3R85_014661 [Psidium guajava]